MHIEIVRHLYTIKVKPSDILYDLFQLQNDKDECVSLYFLIADNRRLTMNAWLLYFLCIKVSLITTEEKRLLLNDPDVLVNRMNRLESIVAVLNSTVQQQSITIQKQEKTIKQLHDYVSTTQSKTFMLFIIHTFNLLFIKKLLYLTIRL